MTEYKLTATNAKIERYKKIMNDPELKANWNTYCKDLCYKRYHTMPDVREKQLQKCIEYNKNNTIIRQNYRDANIEKTKLYNDDYNKKNKDIRDKDPDVMVKFKESRKEIGKTYRDANKEKISAYNKSYREKKKAEKILEDAINNIKITD